MGGLLGLLGPLAWAAGWQASCMAGKLCAAGIGGGAPAACPVCTTLAASPAQHASPNPNPKQTQTNPIVPRPAVTASVYQMMRGAEMLFAALFAVVFLRRSLNRYHYGGIACCVAGISLVGVSSMLSGARGVGRAVWGWWWVVSGRLLLLAVESAGLRSAWRALQAVLPKRRGAPAQARAAPATRCLQKPC